MLPPLWLLVLALFLEPYTLKINLQILPANVQMTGGLSTAEGSWASHIYSFLTCEGGRVLA